MTGWWRSRTRRKRYGNIISKLGVDEAPNQDYVNTVSFVYLLFVQMYVLRLYCVYWILDCKKGANGKESKRDQTPFKEEVDSKLSKQYFRSNYRTTRTSFKNLDEILEHRLWEIFFLRGGNKRNRT